MKIPALPAGVIQSIYEIVKVHGGVSMAIGMKVETKENEVSLLFNCSSLKYRFK
jgi:hypothetical protein